MHGYGRRKRKVVDSYGTKQTYIIRRLRCERCGHIHHELPDIMVPYKRHCIETIEAVIADDIADVCCENSAIRRIRAWWAKCRLYLESVIASLREKYGVPFPADMAPREIIRIVANAHLWVSTRSAWLSG